MLKILGSGQPESNRFMPTDTGSSIPLNRWLVYVLDLDDATEAVRLRAVLGKNFGKVELIESLDTLRTRLDELVKPQLVVLFHEQFKADWFNMVRRLAEKRPKVLFLGVGEEVPAMDRGAKLGETLRMMDENPVGGFITHATWTQLVNPNGLGELRQRLGEIHSRRHQGPKKHY